MWRWGVFLPIYMYHPWVKHTKTTIWKASSLRIPKLIKLDFPSFSTFQRLAYTRRPVPASSIGRPSTMAWHHVAGWHASHRHRFGWMSVRAVSCCGVGLDPRKRRCRRTCRRPALVSLCKYSSFLLFTSRYRFSLLSAHASSSFTITCAQGIEAYMHMSN